MSYEIVKSIAIKQNAQGYYAVITSACNNIRPRHYSKGNYGENQRWSKEELEKHLLKEFFDGNFQKGNSKYRQAVKLISQDEYDGLFKQYEFLNEQASQLYRQIWTSKNVSTEEYENMCIKAALAREVAEEELMDTLYTFMQSHAECFKRTIKPYYIKARSGDYIGYLTRRRYSYSCGAKEFTSRAIYNMVTMEKPYKDIFTVEFVEQ